MSAVELSISRGGPPDRSGKLIGLAQARRLGSWGGFE